MAIGSEYGKHYFRGSIDEVRVNDEIVFVTVDDMTYFHRKHSWRVEGSSIQNVTIVQLLSNEVVEYVRDRKPNQNRGMCFIFWYRPNSANQTLLVFSDRRGVK